jgi:hypothetical protein
VVALSVSTLDTNPIIYYINAEPVAVATRENLFARATSIDTSTIIELELFSSPALTDDEAASIEAFLRRIRVMPLVSSSARKPVTSPDVPSGPRLR